jgi:hypothetical protein
MKNSQGIRQIVLACALVAFAASSGWGKPLAGGRVDKERLQAEGARIEGGVFETVRGFPGWRSTYDARKGGLTKGDNPKVIRPLKEGEILPEKGTMVWWFYYDGSLRPGELTWDTLFTLVGENGEQLFTLYLMPHFQDNTAKSGLTTHNPDGSAFRVYGQWVKFDVPIPPKRWSYLALTWGPNPRQDNRIYLNGVPATGYFEFDGAPARQDLSLEPFLRSARHLYIGGDTEGQDSFNHGAVGEYEFHDEILTSFNFPPRGMPTILSFADDSFKVPGISGKLVAGDKVRFSVEGDPGCRVWVDAGEDRGIPLAEDPNSPGKYFGEYVVSPGRYMENGKAVAHIADDTGLEGTPVASAGTFHIDSRSRFALSIDKTDLPADSSSTARVKVKVTDANGNPVKGHQVKVTLSTTDEYTGLVGGGSARSRDAAEAAKDLLAGADVETRWKGITDSWGEVEFDFKSGFAAKTIILQAKDMTTGDVGVDYITSYKEASIDIALTPPVNRAAARRGLQYLIKVEATRTELTADGRSRSVIRATLLDPNGKPVAGDPVAFALSSQNGTLRTIAATTDSSGTATAEYTAGKKIGIVVVTATATLRNASGNVSITLLSDAPAKVILKARPATLPADGNSRSDIDVKVTDINDNPNGDTKVEFRLARGTGRLDAGERVTDRFGDAANRFTAGTTPGIATIVATVRSKVPTEAELAKARNVLFVPYSDAGEEIRISQWLKRKGDTARKGEPIVEYTVGRSDTQYTLNAPYDCRIDFQYVEYWDRANTGDTLAQITPVVIPGSTNPSPAQPAMAPRRR